MNNSYIFKEYMPKSHNTKTNTMVKFSNEMILTAKNFILLILTIQITSCMGQVNEKSVTPTQENDINTQAPILSQNTIFPQIHSNLNGMVREFVRTMYQDKKGNYWFGTNGDGIIRYDGKTLEKMTVTGISPNFRVLEIVEDHVGHIWFGTSEGLVKYDGVDFKTFSFKEGLPGANAEIWGLTIDNNGLIWVGAVGGLCQFNGEKFIPFPLPVSKAGNANPMLSESLVFKIIEDRNGTMWFAADGNGIFKYKNGEFIHLTTKNGLTDNNVADILEDKKGNIWIGTFNGGVSKFDGKTYTNFTKDGIIDGPETYNLFEDNKGNIWFSAEGYGVYRYDGTNFNHFTSDDGLTTNVVQCIYEDHKGQIWFGTWQGICIYDGLKFVDANIKETWTK